MGTSSDEASSSSDDAYKAWKEAYDKAYNDPAMKAAYEKIKNTVHENPTGYDGPDMYTPIKHTLGVKEKPKLSEEDLQKLFGEYTPPGYYDPNSKHNIAIRRYKWKPPPRDPNKPWKPLPYYPTGNLNKWHYLERQWKRAAWKNFPDKFPTIEMRDRVAECLKPILVPNLKKAMKVFKEQGGFKKLAANTLMTNAMRDRRLRYDIHIANSMGFTGKWDAAKLLKAWDAYISFNGWDPAQVTLRVQEKTDAELPSCEAAFVHVKDNEAMPKSEVIKVWAYLTPTRTYLAGRYQFGHFDGTSIFNFVKGLVHVYFGGAPYKNVQGGAKLPAKADPIVTLDDHVATQKFGLLAALFAGFKESVVAAFMKANAAKLPPPLRGLPPQHARCASFDKATTATWVKNPKSQRAAPFEWMVRCSAPRR